MRRALTVLFASLFVVFNVNAQSGLLLTIRNIQATPTLDKSGYNVVISLSAVDAKGSPLQGLTNSNFTIKEDGKDVTNFKVAPYAPPINVVLAIDTSETMTYQIEGMKEAGVTFLKGLSQGDQSGLISFNSKQTTEHSLTTGNADVVNAVQRLKAAPNTVMCLWDAAYYAAQLASSSPVGQRAIVILTSGLDYARPGQTCSNKTIDDAIKLATDNTSRVPIHVVAMKQWARTQEVSRLAELTGGQVFFVESGKDASTYLTALSQQMRSGYQIGYTSSISSGEHALFLQLDHQGSRAQTTQKFNTQTLGSLAIDGVENGQTVSANLQVSVGSSGQTQVSRVVLLVNDKPTAEDSQSPFAFTISWTNFTPGAYKLRFVGYDSAGAAIAEREISVTYRSPDAAATPSSTSAKLNLVGVSEGATISGKITIEAKVEGATPQKVEFYVGDTLLSSDTSAPFEATWDVANATPGNQVLRAVAFDDKGATLAEKKVNVTYQPANASYSTPLVLGAIVLVVLGLAVGGFFMTKRRKTESPSPVIDLTLDKVSVSVSERTLATLTVEAFGGESNLLAPGTEFPIRQSQKIVTITIGRQNSDILIPDRAVSKSHAQITLGGGGDTVEQSSGLPGETVDEINLGSTDMFYITDIESKFGTFVDDKQIPSGKAMPLRNGALIKLGKRTMLRFHDLRPSSGVSAGLSGETIDEFNLNDGETQDQLGSR